MPASESASGSSRGSASIDHPNVIPIYEAGEAEGQLYIAMRYVEGADLRRLIDEDGALDPARAVELWRGLRTGSRRRTTVGSCTGT